MFISLGIINLVKLVSLIIGIWLSYVNIFVGIRGNSVSWTNIALMSTAVGIFIYLQWIAV